MKLNKASNLQYQKDLKIHSQALGCGAVSSHGKLFKKA